MGPPARLLERRIAEWQWLEVGHRADRFHPDSKLVFHAFGVLAEFERDLVRARTRAGSAARARGRNCERAKKLGDRKMLALARRLHSDWQADVATICRTLAISRATLYRSLRPQSDGTTPAS